MNNSTGLKTDPAKAAAWRRDSAERYAAKPRKPMKAKRNVRGNESGYPELRRAYLEANPLCHHCLEAGLPQLPATEVHHVAGRVGDLLTDQRFWMAVSHDCHVWITANPDIAYPNGWKISALTTEDVRLETLRRLRGRFEWVARALRE